jgi:hypothetical protein
MRERQGDESTLYREGAYRKAGRWRLRNRDIKVLGQANALSGYPFVFVFSGVREARF